MPDNNPSSNKRNRGKNKRKREKKQQKQMQNSNNATVSHQHNNKKHYSGADLTPADPDTININIHNHNIQYPQFGSAHDSVGSSPQATAAVSQLHQAGRTSAAMHHTEAKKGQKNIQNFFKTTSKHQEKSNRENLTLCRTIVIHPRISAGHSSEGSSSQSTTITHSQGIIGSTTEPHREATNSTHYLAPFTASVGPPTVQKSVFADSKPHHSRAVVGSSPHLSSAVAGPSKQSSVQKTACSFSLTQVSTGVPSKYLAIDCEMVGAGHKGNISQLARCSIVSYDGDVVYDKFIKPPLPITDYRTRWSGIRKHDLHRATPFAEARKQILTLVRSKVLIGHAIHNDLKVLNYCHPKDLVRDTSRIPLLNIKAGFNEKEVVSLKRLTKALLKRNIQTGTKGHSSVEDAKATMELYKVVEVEWEQTLTSNTKEPSKGKQMQ